MEKRSSVLDGFSDDLPWTWDTYRGESEVSVLLCFTEGSAHLGEDGVGR